MITIINAIQMNTKINILMMIGILPIYMSGQNQFPIKLAIGNEATTVPFTTFINESLHPTIQLGTEYTYRNRKHSELYQTGNIGYIYHKHLYQGIYINTGIGYDYKTGFGLKLKSNLEVGYLHTFTTQDEFQFENGEYVNGADNGNSRVMPSLSVGVGFAFNKDGKVFSELFVLYKSWIEYPYSPGFIPLMSHTIIEIGYKFYLKSHGKK